MSRTASTPSKSARNPLRRVAAGAVIVLFATVASLLPYHVPGLRDGMGLADNVFYDAFYRLRPVEDRTGGDVIIVAIDGRSREAVAAQFKFGWPWPRELTGRIAAYLDQSGARAVGLDLLFLHPSSYQQATGDDDAFAETINGLRTPVIFGALVDDQGRPTPTAPPVKDPTFGAVNVGTDKVYRVYRPTVNGFPSLALATVRRAGASPPADLTDRPFGLHYYGPHQDEGGRRTYRFISAASVLAAALEPDQASAVGITPDLFRGKIVLIGPTDPGLYDLKSTPLSEIYPGVEVQATAVDNLLRGQFVRPGGPPALHGTAALCAAVAVVGVMLPRRASVKLACGTVAVLLAPAVAAALFLGEQIDWLPPTPAVIAAAVAGSAGFARTYFLEDARRRFVVRALGQYVSPAVADQIAADPDRLKLGGERRKMSVLFTDIAGFTDFSERLDVERLSTLLNYYLDEMSGVVLAHDGTLDKYVGDAVMAFWNAPADQPDHAARACRAALGMAARERAIQPELQRLSDGVRLFTRIGINTGPMAVGNMGSSKKFNYTVLGDPVNLGSRLEGANKFYGTQILVAESTAKLVAEQFLMRRVDVLRVKGKQQPMAVYELLAERTGDGGHGAASNGLADRVSLYEAALDAYRGQRWDDAERQLVELRGRFGDDGPAEALLKRVAALRLEPPPPGWDGVYVATDK